MGHYKAAQRPDPPAWLAVGVDTGFAAMCQDDFTESGYLECQGIGMVIFNRQGPRFTYIAWAPYFYRESGRARPNGDVFTALGRCTPE